MGIARPGQLAGVLILLVQLIYAHESPEHEIEALTARMAASGKTAELLGRRATEWRALGKWNEASVDLQEALSLNPRSVPLLCELAQVEAGHHQYDRAIKAVDRALALTDQETERSGIYMLRGEIFERKGDYHAALADCTRAFACGMPAIDWYLTRGRLQSRAGKWRDCASGLQQGYEATGSIVLEIEWIEALIDAGEFEVALKRIEPYAEGGRWKSAWLIRRARARIGKGDTTPAHEDLAKALAELAERLTSNKPETSLLIERGLSQALLGKIPAAKADFKRVEELKDDQVIFSSALDRLRRALKQ
jgi:tetratricopeptide (TPR) repeat protein